MVRHLSACAALSATLLAACGGSGGGGSDTPAVAQNVSWVRTAGGPGVPSGAGATAVFSDGSSVSTGSFEGSVDVGGTPLTSLGLNDSFLVRYGADGTFAWAQSVGGADVTYVTQVASFTDGSFAICGGFAADVTFGAGQANETTFVSNGLHDGFVAKYTGDGQLLWARQMGGNDWYDQALGVAALPDGSVAVAGWIGSSSVTFGQGEATETTLHPAWNGSCFIARYGPTGDFAWVRTAASAGSQMANTVFNGLASRADGTLAACLGYQGTATFGVGEVNETTFTSSDSGNSTDSGVAVYASDGTLLWARTVGGTAFDYTMGVAIDDSAVVVGGGFYDNFTAGVESGAPAALSAPATTAGWIARYDVAGSFEWARQIGLAAAEPHSSVVASVRLFGDHGVAVVGSFSGTAVFGAGEANETTLVGAGTDGFVARYQPDGSLDFVSVVTDSGKGETLGVAPLSDGSFVVCGYFQTDGVIGAGDPNESPLVGVGTQDLYVARYNPDGHF